MVGCGEVETDEAIGREVEVRMEQDIALERGVLESRVNL